MDSITQHYVHIICFSFSEEQICNTKKLVVSPRSHPASICMIHVYFLHMYRYMYSEIQSIWFLRALRVPRPDHCALIRVTHVQCVCVCAYTYTYIHTHPKPGQKKSRQTTPIGHIAAYLPRVKNMSYASNKSPA